MRIEYKWFSISACARSTPVRYIATISVSQSETSRRPGCPVASNMASRSSLSASRHSTKCIMASASSRAALRSRRVSAMNVSLSEAASSGSGSSSSALVPSALVSSFSLSMSSSLVLMMSPSVDSSDGGSYSSVDDCSSDSA